MWKSTTFIIILGVIALVLVVIAIFLIMRPGSSPQYGGSSNCGRKMYGGRRR
jgi:hypothetical protein